MWGLKMRSHCSRWTSRPRGQRPSQAWRFGRRGSQREDRVAREAVPGVPSLQAKDPRPVQGHQQTAAAGRRAWRGPSHTASEGTSPADALLLDPWPPTDPESLFKPPARPPSMIFCYSSTSALAQGYSKDCLGRCLWEQQALDLGRGRCSRAQALGLPAPRDVALVQAAEKLRGCSWGELSTSACIKYTHGPGNGHQLHFWRHTQRNPTR